MSSDKIKVGIVGLGYIAQYIHIPALMSIEGVKITTLCDKNEETLHKVGSLYHINSLYDDSIEMAEKSDCDCVFVLTRPDSTHPTISNLMLENGKDVLCEKAMATKLSEAKNMIKIAEDNSRILMVGFNRRFMPVCKKAKEVFTGRELDLCKVTFNGFKPKANAILGNPHPVDLLRFYCGDAISVNCISKYDSSANEESITALIEFKSGVAGVLIFNNQSGGYAENVELHGGGYSVIVDMISQTTRIMKNVNANLLTPQEWIEYRPSKWDGFLRENGFAQQDEHFIECVRTRKQPLYTAQDAYKSHELVSEIYKKSGLSTFE